MPVSCADGTVRVDLLAVSGEQRLICDAQRNYHRSRWNGRPLDGEWIMRLYPLPAEEAGGDGEGSLPENRTLPVEK